MTAPVTLTQERMWLQDRLAPGDPSYNMFLVRRLRGDLDSDALQRAVDDLSARHEPLRTVFDCDAAGVLRQHTTAPAPVPIEHVDLSAGDPATVEQRTHAAVAARTNEPFDPATAPLLRVALLRLAPHDHVLVLVMHHLVADGWSLDVLAGDLGRRYRGHRRGADEPLPPLTTSHARWAGGQRAAGIDPTAQEFWREQLAGLDPPQLPADLPGGGDSSGAYHTHRLPADLTAAVEQLARSARCSLFMTLLTAYQALLHCYTGQRDIAVGTFTAGRDQVQTEPLVGCFLHTIVLRGDLTGDPSFTDLLARTRNTALRAYAHPAVPFEQLLADGPGGRDPSRQGLLRTTFVLQNPHSAAFTLDGLTTEPFDDGFRHSKLDLAVEAWRDAHGLAVIFGYRARLFSPHAVARLGAHFEALLRQVVADPATRLRDLDPLLPAERAQLTAWARGPEPELDSAGRTVAHLIADRARTTPGAVALRQGQHRLGYAQLHQRVAATAAKLRAAGVTAGDVVGICLPPSFDLVTAMLACWQTGAAYLPLDPSYPDARLHHLVRDSNATAVVAPAGLHHRLPAAPTLLDLTEPPPALSIPGADVPDHADGPHDSGAPAARPGDTAYLIYTSGSTGQPKGVRVSHRALTARVRWMRAHYRLEPGDTVLQFAATSFDTHAEEVFPSLSAGATLLLREQPDALLPEILATPAGGDVTVLDLPTAYWHELVDGEVAWPSGLRLLILGADQVDAAALARWHATHGERIRLVNTYGPTETTIVATAHELTAADADRIVPIGRPLAGVRAYVLGGDLRMLPAGAVGELYLGGTGLADGYHGRAGLTASRFVPDPFGPPGARLYRTGDRVRLDSAGVLTFLGRDDDQVKIRGFRIETGEVQAHLLDHPGVTQAAVVAREVIAGDRRLVAYVVAPDVEAADLRAHLTERLPAHLVPNWFVALPRLPLNRHGKVDRAALPDPADQRLREQPHTPPRTDAEELVAQVWQDVLGVDRVGAHDDFFAVGGHSLLATRVAARLTATVEVPVPLRTLFTHRTLAALAAAVEQLILADLDRLTDDEAQALLGGQA
ncbi:non-ribosomal peptide synthetase [Catellatospora sichuanensis]|uniref:non-ribosomal peptide synthetase n=1 Tax=Catellatospora sichuanensis TaxID=1969805 RepID=UPI0011823C4A|nr:non-ribosomal peptide synthetase [Catellatospora sichuanensis]